MSIKGDCCASDDEEKDTQHNETMMFSRSIVRGIALNNDLREAWWPAMKMSTLATVIKATTKVSGLVNKPGVLQKNLTMMRDKKKKETKFATDEENDILEKELKQYDERN